MDSWRYYTSAKRISAILVHCFLRPRIPLEYSQGSPAVRPLEKVGRLIPAFSVSDDHTDETVLNNRGRIELPNWLCPRD